MAAIVDGRPIIVLAHDLDAPARLAFLVAHEVAHIVNGDCSPDRPVVDDEEEIPDQSSIERLADDFAAAVLTGGAQVPAIEASQYKELAIKAAEVEKKLGVDASSVVWAWARKSGNYALATMAAQALYCTKGGKQCCVPNSISTSTSTRRPIATVRCFAVYTVIHRVPRLLVDSDLFAKLGIAGLLGRLLEFLGVELAECGRLPALPHMLRRGGIPALYGSDRCERLVPTADQMGVIPPASTSWLARVAGVSQIDAGEAQLFASAAEHGLLIVTGDKRSVIAMSQLDAFPAALSGRIISMEAALLALCGRLGAEPVRAALAPLVAVKDKEGEDGWGLLLARQFRSRCGVELVLRGSQEEGRAAGTLASSGEGRGMTFKADHYVPVLKLKRGEKRALQDLSEKIRPRVTPLFEVVERKDEKDVAEHIDTAFKGLELSVAQFPRYFLDCIEIESDGAPAATDVFRRAATLRTRFTPVTGLSRTADVAAAMNHRANGIAIRLTREEFEDGRIPSQLPAFMAGNKLDPEAVDLIVDLGAVDDMVTPGIEALAAAFLADVPNHKRWRTLTISSCAFPQSMAGVDGSSHDLVDRAEWHAWRDALHANRASLDRLPTFSDCAIQHPSGVEGFDFRFMQLSASIRYSLPEQWLLIKGVSTRRVLPSTQFPQLAKHLVYGHLLPYYGGAGHCTGCKLMKDAADGRNGLGSAEAWRLLGTIHHITVAVEQIAKLTWP